MIIALGNSGHEGLLAGIGVLWAILFLIAAILCITLGVQLRKERRRSRELQDQVDYSARRRRMAMELFHTLGSAFESEIGTEELLQHIVRFFMRIVQATGGCAFLLDPERQELRPMAMSGKCSAGITAKTAGPTDAPCSFRMGEGIVGEVAAQGRSKFIADGRSEPGLRQLEKGEWRIENAIIMPLKFRDEVLGVVLVVNRLVDPDRASTAFGRFEFQLLEALSIYAAVAVKLLVSYIAQSERLRLDFDLRVASEVQQLLLPRSAPVLHDFTVSGRSVAAHRLGGDYFDFLVLGEDRLGIIIADVSGKGVTGALVMGLCRSTVHARAANHESPADALRELSRLMLPDLPEDMFVTMTYGILNSRERKFRFARAGHDPLLHYQKATGEVVALAPKGPAIGLIRSEGFIPNFDEAEIALEPGEAIVLFTDGITETPDPQGEEFGRERLMTVISEQAKEDAHGLSAATFEHVLRFSKGAPPNDDQTLVVLRANPDNSPRSPETRTGIA